MVHLDFKIKTVILYKPAMLNLLNSPNGELGKELGRLGDRIVRNARMMAGKKTGRLVRSIHKRHLGNITGQYIWVGSTVPYALAHHEGTRPHVITPKEPDGKLVFFKGSRMIVTRRVMHPGTKANPYLRNALIKSMGSL